MDESSRRISGMVLGTKSKDKSKLSSIVNQLGMRSVEFSVCLSLSFAREKTENGRRNKEGHCIYKQRRFRRLRFD